MARPSVLLATEGTYPYHQGGVSTWCDTLVHQIPEVDFTIFAIAMNPYVSVLFDIPGNVQRIVSVPLWGMQDPSEHREELAYSEIFLQKQRTGAEEINVRFLPAFEKFLNGLSEVGEAGSLGQSLVEMYQFFRLYDYYTTFKSNDVWTLFKTWALQTAQRGFWSEPTVFESVQGLGWIYHFLTVLNTAIPSVDVVHSSAAAFCGMVGIVSKLESGTPYVLTEHGVYLREQYLSIGRSNMTPFSKRFLISMVKAISKENLYYADELSPVCAFNGRWERVLGANAEKIRVIYNGVSAKRFHPTDRESPRLEVGATKTAEPLRVLSVARIDPNKDLDTLLRAVSLVHSFGIPIKVKVQGSISVPQYNEEIMALARHLKLGDIVEFSGHTDDMGRVYRESDLAVQSSVTEAFPYSAIESMMSGIPMVATDVGGTREALGSTGILVPSRDPGQLALGIAMLAQDAELRHRLGRAARERALTYFEISDTLSRFLALYQRWQRHGDVPQPDREAIFVADPALLAVTRGVLLERLGQSLLAEQEFLTALSLLGNHPAAVPLLAEVANLAWRGGKTHQATQYLLKAKMLENVFHYERAQVG